MSGAKLGVGEWWYELGKLYEMSIDGYINFHQGQEANLQFFHYHYHLDWVQKYNCYLDYYLEIYEKARHGLCLSLMIIGLYLGNNLCKRVGQSQVCLFVFVCLYLLHKVFKPHFFTRKFPTLPFPLSIHISGSLTVSWVALFSVANDWYLLAQLHQVHNQTCLCSAWEAFFSAFRTWRTAAFFLPTLPFPLFIYISGSLTVSWMTPFSIASDWYLLA